MLNGWQKLENSEIDLMSFYVCLNSIFSDALSGHHTHAKMNLSSSFNIQFSRYFNSFSNKSHNKFSMQNPILNKEKQWKKESENFNSFPCMNIFVMQLSGAWRDSDGWRGHSTKLRESVGSDSSARVASGCNHAQQHVVLATTIHILQLERSK